MRGVVEVDVGVAQPVEHERATRLATGIGHDLRAVVRRLGVAPARAQRGREATDDHHRSRSPGPAADAPAQQHLDDDGAEHEQQAERQQDRADPQARDEDEARHDRSGDRPDGADARQPAHDRARPVEGLQLELGDHRCHCREQGSGNQDRHRSHEQHRAPTGGCRRLTRPADRERRHGHHRPGHPEERGEHAARVDEVGVGPTGPRSRPRWRRVRCRSPWCSSRASAPGRERAGGAR